MRVEEYKGKLLTPKASGDCYGCPYNENECVREGGKDRCFDDYHTRCLREMTEIEIKELAEELINDTALLLSKLPRKYTVKVIRGLKEIKHEVLLSLKRP